MKRVALALTIGLLAAPALAAGGDMSVATFLAKADALKAKGPMALFSPDIKVLQQEGQAAGMATIAAAYGYCGDHDPPARWGADALVAHPGEIVGLLRF